MGILKPKKVAAKVETKKEVVVSKEAKTFVPSNVLLRPVITEKSAILASQNMYVFAVKTTANRITIAAAIKAMYDVKPLSVNVVNVRGKVVSRGRVAGKRSAWKKAIVTLPKGKTLNIYEGV